MPHAQARVSLACVRALQRSRGTGPRATEKKRYFIVGRGPSDATRASERVPLAMRLAVRPHPLCRSGSPDPDPFVIRRSQTTERENEKLGRLHCEGQALALRAAGMFKHRGRSRGTGPRATGPGGVRPIGNSRGTGPRATGRGDVRPRESPREVRSFHRAFSSAI